MPRNDWSLLRSRVIGTLTGGVRPSDEAGATPTSLPDREVKGNARVSEQFSSPEHIAHVATSVAQAGQEIRSLALHQLHHSVEALESRLPTPRGHNYYIDLFMKGFSFGHRGEGLEIAGGYKIHRPQSRVPHLAIDGLGCLCGRSLAAEVLCASVAPYGRFHTFPVERSHIAHFLRTNPLNPHAYHHEKTQFQEQVTTHLKQVSAHVEQRLEEIGSHVALDEADETHQRLAALFAAGVRERYDPTFARRSFDGSLQSVDDMMRFMGSVYGEFRAMVTITGSWTELAIYDEPDTGKVVQMARSEAQERLARGQARAAAAAPPPAPVEERQRGLSWRWAR